VEDYRWYKLSLKNCQAIENGYDLDELAENKWNELSKQLGLSIQDKAMWRGGFKHGLLEILGDKKFSINEVIELCKILMSNPFEKCGKTYQELTDSYIQSLQPTKWDVEIEMEYQGFEEDGKLKEAYLPKLDENGNLILRKL
jgi:hypothetical protein